MGKLKEIENRYYKECNVVMLPTKDETYIVQFSDKSFRFKKRMDDTFKPANYSHLYITSDDKIKESDWCYESETNVIFQAKEFTKSGLVRSNENTFILDACKKIISTTDKSLLHTVGKIKSSIHNWQENVKSNIPQPSQSFIKKYCELGGIDKILVEYVYNKGGICPDQCNCKEECLMMNTIKLKTDSHNTIIIKPVKNRLVTLDAKLLNQYQMVVFI